MNTRLPGALVSMVLTVLVAATNAYKCDAAAQPDAAQVAENLRQAGAAVKLDAHRNVIAVDFGRARPRDFDYSQVSALRDCAA